LQHDEPVSPFDITRDGGADEEDDRFHGGRDDNAGEGKKEQVKW
jgi:hypothetical protein